MSSEDIIVERVIDLWNGGRGWIPGAAYKKLAAALGVSTDRLTHYDMGTRKHTITSVPCRCDDPRYLYCWPHRKVVGS